MNILAMLGAVGIGLALGIFGSGGSIMTVPVLRYLLGHGEKASIQESLAIVGIVAAAAAIPAARARLVSWTRVIQFGLPAMLGTSIGAWIGGFVPGAVQLVVFALVMLGAARAMWVREQVPAATGAPPPGRAVRTVVEGLAVGALTGFVGVGGGFLIVPALVVLGGLAMRLAVGTSLVIIALKSAVGYVSYAVTLRGSGVEIDPQAIALVSAFGVGGSFAGRFISGRLPVAVLRRGFAIFLVLVAVLVLAREGPSLVPEAWRRTARGDGTPVAAAWCSMPPDSSGRGGAGLAGCAGEPR